MGKSVFMQYTEKTVKESVKDINNILIDYQARAISFQYRDKEVIGISFILECEGKEIPIKLPIKVEKVAIALKKKRISASEDRVKRIAWRMNFRLVEALCAYSVSEQAEFAELFLPWAILQGEKTFFQLFKEKGLKLLEK